VVIYKTPLPRMKTLGNIQDSSDLEERALAAIPRDTGLGDLTSSDYGVFIGPLEEEAFEKHSEGLTWYWRPANESASFVANAVTRIE
jgi:hypothetical protein